MACITFRALFGRATLGAVRQRLATRIALAILLVQIVSGFASCATLLIAASRLAEWDTAALDDSALITNVSIRAIALRALLLVTLMAKLSEELRAGTAANLG